MISLRGSSYYMIFIDDSMTKAWILKHKSDILMLFRRKKVLLDNDVGLKVQMLVI